MTPAELELLSKVQDKCTEKPEFLSHVIQVGVQALTEREKHFREQAADMETMASAMAFLVGQSRVSPKLKEEMSNLALSKLGKYLPNKTFLKWNSKVEEENE